MPASTPGYRLLSDPFSPSLSCLIGWPLALPTPLLIAVPLAGDGDVDALVAHASSSPASEARAAAPAVLFSRTRRLRLPKRSRAQTRALMLRAATELVCEGINDNSDAAVAAALAHVQLTEVAARATRIVAAELAAGPVPGGPVPGGGAPLAGDMAP